MALGREGTGAERTQEQNDRDSLQARVAGSETREREASELQDSNNRLFSLLNAAPVTCTSEEPTADNAGLPGLSMCLYALVDCS